MKSETERFLEARIGAQRSATWIQVAALSAAGVCIALAAMLQSPINQKRQELQLVLHSDLYKELPAKYAWVTAAAGTFRGVAADVLWMRAEKLKEEGKYYESHQLAQWICTLQPRFAQVWSFQSWNMAYNISVATHTGPERWQWVYNGIRLLRDEGIPNNPKVVPLYHQLAWTYVHKIGDRADDFHWYYKRIWAAIMETLLGSPPGTASNAEAIDAFRPIAEAPATLAELIAAHPGIEKLVAQLADLGIDVEVGTDSQKLYHPLEVNFFKSYTAYGFERGLASLRSSGQERKRREEEKPESGLWGFFDAAPKEDFNALLAYLRAKVLREQYKMDPQYMLALTGDLGTDEPIPFDWRTPWAHSLYWAKYGVEEGKKLNNVKEFDLINTDRILLASLAKLCSQGRYTFRINLDDPGNSFLAPPSPDVRFIEAMHRKYIELGVFHAEEYEKKEGISNKAGEMLRSGHVNHLQSGIVALYLAGKREQAQHYLDYLAVNYKDPYSHKTKPLYLQGLDDFVRSQFKEMVTSYTEAIYMIVSILNSGYMNLAAGRLDEYNAALQNAKTLFDAYQKDHQDDQRGRLRLTRFIDLRSQALGNFVLNPQYPLLYRSIAWNRESDELKRRYYDVVAPQLAQQCEVLDLDVSRAFPEPTGMAQWRKDHPLPDNPEEISQQEKEKREQSQKQAP